MTALKASQIHNERLTDRHSNPDIDIDRSDQNVVFFKTGNLLENVRERVASKPDKSEKSAEMHPLPSNT